MRLIVFFAFVGSICALQYSVEYHYHYEGQISSGIPAIRPQVAALGIKAKLILQMKEKTRAIAKLTDIEVGEHHDDLQCVRLRQPIPFSYQNMPEPHKQLLEQPFAVYFQEESGHVLDVHRSDVEFITNIRKSIVEMLRLEPIVANLGGVKGDQLSKYMSGSEAPEAFIVEEESILGRCESEYSITKLSPSEVLEEKAIIDKYLKKDDQSKSSPRSSASDIPKLEDQYHRLVRAINFEKCHDIVIQQHAGGANMSDAGSSLFRAVQSRSSVSTYILKGKPGSFRVDRAIVEGDVIVNPFGFKTEKLQSITNQTLVLESAQSIQSKIILPSDVKPIKSWRFEVFSPFQKPNGHSKEWINYQDMKDKYYPVTILSSIGIHSTKEEIKRIEDTIIRLLDTAEQELYAEPSLPSNNNPSSMTKTSSATKHLYIISKLIRYLNISSIRDIFSKVFEKNDVISQHKQMLLIDTAAASGASAPMKILLEKIKRQEISHHRISSIFLTIPNNLYSPSIIPELMEYVKSLDIEANPLLTSSALINFASLAERVCISHRKFNYSIPHELFGNEDCNHAQISTNFLPFLVKRAQKASKSHERAIYIQAINNLGSPEIIEALKPFIYGKFDHNPQVRSVAIYGLSRLRLPDSVRERVFDILMTVVDNLRERSDIRQAAFTTLVTWHPSTSFWQRMARSTWREPSLNMATFITLTVESIAKSTEPHLKHQSRIASFVLPLLKPFSPSFHSSYNRIYSRYDKESEVGKRFDFTRIESPNDSLPTEIFTNLRENYGGLFLHLFEISVSSENVGKTMSEILNMMRGASAEGRRGTFNARNPSDRRSMESMSIMKRLMSESDTVNVNIFLRAFENLYQYIPINSDVISKVAGKDAENIIQKLVSGVKIEATKYLDPINIEFLIPTEIGLPLRGQASMPTVNLGDSDVRLHADDLQNPSFKELLKQNRSSLLFKSNYKYSSKLIVKLSTLSPWNERVIETGVENYDELNLPFYANISLSRSDEVKNFSINLSPHTQQQFPILHQHNFPFTVTRKLIPDKDSEVDLKVIGVQRDRKPSIEVRKEFDQKYTGLSSRLEYSGDASYPFTSAFIMDYLRKPVLQGKLLTSPVARQWHYSFSLNPKSEARNVTLAVSFVSTEMKHGKNVKGSEIPDFSANDDPQQRLDKMRQTGPESKIYGLNVQLFFNATDFRRYEIVSTCASETELQSSTPKKRRVIVAALVSKIPGHVDGPRALCSSGHYTSPGIEDLNSLRSAVESHPKVDYSSEIHYGSSCQSSNIANIKGTLKLSDERQKLVSDELKKVCNYDPKDPAIELQTAAVYDIGTLDIEFLKEKIPTSLLNASYSLQEFVEGALFPHGYYNNMHSGQPNKIRVDARRPVSTKKYSFFVETPQKHSIFHEIHVPYFATRIVPVGGLKTTLDKVTDTLLISTDAPNACVVKRGSIKTFDHVSYQYNPVAGTGPCWSVAVRDNNKKNTPKYLVQVRENTNGLLEAQIKTGDNSIHIEVTYQQAFINGKEMPKNEPMKTVTDTSKKVIIIVKRQKNGYKVEWVGEFETYVTSDEIEVVPKLSIKNSVRGLCGDFDGNTKWDKTGPKNCIYTDDKLFEYSWTTSEGDGCDKTSEQQMQDQVQKFQNGCSLRPNNSFMDLYAIYQSKDDDCIQNVFPVHQQGPLWCAAYEPVTLCKPECQVVTNKVTKVPAGCWPNKEVPKDVAEGEKRGYIYKPPAEKAPLHENLFTMQAIKCVKK